MKNLLLTLAGLLIGATAGEVGLRVLGFSYFTFERPDPIRGVSLSPNAKARHTWEGRTYVEINEHGYRDRERPKRKPTGTYRIAVLGDSFVEARHVPLDDTFCAALERTLNAQPIFGGKSVEVLNFGVSGYGTTQELLTLRQDVYDFEPDHVILAFFTENDVTDNSKALSHPLEARPYFTLGGDELVLDTSFLQSETFQDRQRWIAKLFYLTQNHSRVIQLLYQARRRFQQNLPARVSPFVQPLLPRDIYREPAESSWKEAWRVTERIILEMHKELTQRGIKFGVVTLSNPTQVYPDPSKRQEFAEQLNVKDLFYPDRRIKALGDQAGFPVLNLAPSFQAYADQHHVFLHGFASTRLGLGHWNEQGHRLAARMIAQWLTSELFPRE